MIGDDTTRRAAELPRASARCRGVVMVIALLAIVLIASLLFYVINVGRSVQGRVVTQHAADAAAIGGAGWVARSMNSVAMNNVDSTRLIVAINVLDALPLAVDLSYTDPTEQNIGDVDALDQAIAAQLRARVIDNWFARQLRTMMDPANPEGVPAERRHLQELDALFRNQPDLVANMTRYQAPLGGLGQMHQALRSLDAASRAVMQTLGEAAQSAAVRSAQANLGNDDADAAGLLLPAAPDIPWQRGVFDDFERPVRMGLLPGQDERLDVDTLAKGFGQVDDTVLRRGPWDAVFGWRDTNAQAAIAGGFSTGGFPSAPVTTVNRPTRAKPATKYWVRSPLSLRMPSFNNRAYNRLNEHLADISLVKAGYLWPGTALGTVNEPNWEIDIDHDNERSNDANTDDVYSLSSSDIHETLFIIGQIKSRVSNDPGLPGRQGVTWDYVRDAPTLLYLRGWRDPVKGVPIGIDPAFKPQWRKVQDHIWRLSAVYETNPKAPDLGGDPSIGLPAKRIGTAPNGTPIYAAQEVHWEVDFMFVGVNYGKDIEVSNPWDGFDRDAEDAPAPVDFIHELMPPNEFTRRQRLTFLGIARKPSRPDFWPTRFDGDRAYPYNSAIAQARVFNNHSFDLWTQTWQAQLEPVSDYNAWLEHADAAVDDAEQIPGLDPDEVRQIAEHLRSVQNLAPVMLNH